MRRRRKQRAPRHISRGRRVAIQIAIDDRRERPVFIARRVSWSADSRSIFAAIGEGDADIVLLDGLIKGAAR